jgi:SNF2 family DNA or RNA helicase
MRPREQMHGYQGRMSELMKQLPFMAAWMDMGLGKTVTTLTATSDLLDFMEVRRPLVVAPKKIAEKVWDDECTEWQHIRHLRIRQIVGTVKQRQKIVNSEDGDLWIISRDNIAWLVDYMGSLWNFDLVILDESSSFKSSDSVRFRRLKKVVDAGLIRRMIQLTGTPSPNGYMDLWSQIYLLDRGQRLEKTITGYRQRYFYKAEGGMRYELRPGAEQFINSLLSDICFSLRKEDWLQLKPREDILRKVVLPNMEDYNKFKRDQVMQILGEDGSAEITALNAAALYSKLLQFCNGAVYDADHTYHVVQQAKLEALEEMIEELGDNNVLVFYQFQSDIDRIMNTIPGVRMLKTGQDIDDWNAGKIKVLLAHPLSAGHGLNLQKGGHYIIWYGLPAMLEAYLQGIGRLDRQGQLHTVFNIVLITEGTIEERVWKRIIDKTMSQEGLIDSVKLEIAELLKIPQPADEWWL